MITGFQPSNSARERLTGKQFLDDCIRLLGEVGGFNSRPVGQERTSRTNGTLFLFAVGIFLDPCPPVQKRDQCLQRDLRRTNERFARWAGLASKGPAPPAPLRRSDCACPVAIETADYAIALGKGDPTRRPTIALQWLIDRSLICKAEAI